MCLSVPGKVYGSHDRFMEIGKEKVSKEQGSSKKEKVVYIQQVFIMVMIV